MPELAIEIMAIDLLPARRAKAASIVALYWPDLLQIAGEGSPETNSKVHFCSPEEALGFAVGNEEDGVHGVLEVVGNDAALKLACTLVRPFGVISSVGM